MDLGMDWTREDWERAERAIGKKVRMILDDFMVSLQEDGTRRGLTPEELATFKRVLNEVKA